MTLVIAVNAVLAVFTVTWLLVLLGRQIFAPHVDYEPALMRSRRRSRRAPSAAFLRSASQSM